MNKKRIFSGIKPSGDLHLGNYLGAIRQWLELQDEYDAVFSVVDLHAVTVPQDPVELRQKTLEIAKIYLAAGIDPKKCILFIQSHVKEHAELCWLLNTITKTGDLTKMTQFKDKAGMDFDKLEAFLEKIGKEEFVDDLMKKSIEEVPESYKEGLPEKISRDNAIKIVFHRGLATGFERGINNAKKFFSLSKEQFNSSGVAFFDYPVLMAADILLYDTDVVPVGEDQVQHVELARTLARRFNDRFGETFTVPEARVNQESARIMRLDDPVKKMSKSAASEYGYIALTDDAEIVRKKIKKAVTDSGSEIVYSDEKPALKNLINIYSLLSNKTPQEIETMYAGKGYGDFKSDLAEVVVGFLVPFQERLAAISDDEVLALLRDGAEKARTLAVAKLDEVKKKVGFVI